MPDDQLHIDSAYLAVKPFKVADLVPHPLSATIFGQLSDVQFADLQADIAKFKLRHPLELDAHSRVICGSQRLRAVRELGWEYVPCIVRSELHDEEEIREWLICDNVRRRQLTPAQVFRAGVELERIKRVQAERRRLDALSRVNDPTLSPSGDNGEPGRTDDQVARQLGTSAETYRRIKRVYRSGDQELMDMVEHGLMSITAAARRVEQPKRVRKLADDDARALPLRVAKWITIVTKFCDWLDSHPPSFDHLNPKTRQPLERLRKRIDDLLRRK